MKEEHKLGYTIFKTILGPIFKFWYNPKIIGKENIPQCLLYYASLRLTHIETTLHRLKFYHNIQ